MSASTETLDRIVSMEATIGEVIAYMKESNAGIFKITPMKGQTILGSIVFMGQDEANEILPMIEKLERNWEEEDQS